MAIETLDDIIEELADRCGVYGTYNSQNDTFEEHTFDCDCRICFTRELESRIREAMRIEQVLQERKVSRKCPICGRFTIDWEPRWNAFKCFAADCSWYGNVPPPILDEDISQTARRLAEHRPPPSPL